MRAIEFTEAIEKTAHQKDFEQKKHNLQTCIDYMTKMLKKRGQRWCTNKLVKKMPLVFRYNKEKKGIELTREATLGKFQIVKGMVYTEW